MRFSAVPLLCGCLLGCAAAPSPLPNPAPVATPVPLASIPPGISGLDLEGFDRSVRPVDDLYRFVTGGWQARTPIPDDRANWGTIAMLTARAQQDLHALVEELAARPQALGSNARRIADFYASFMDEGRVRSGGLAPLAGERARIRALRQPSDLAAWLGSAQKLGFTAGLDGTRVGMDAPLDYSVEADLRDSAHYIGYLGQAGLTLPDRDSYLSSAASQRAQRRALRRYAERLLAAAHEPGARLKAGRVLALETQLARAQWSPVRMRDPLATYHRMNLRELERVAPGFPWGRFFAAAGAPDAVVIVAEPDYLRAVARLARRVPIQEWRAWLTFKLLDGYAYALPPPFEDLAFDFHSGTLLGVAQPAPRWQRAIEALDLQLGEALGEEYVARHFSAEAKSRARTLIDNVLRAYDAALDGVDWMSPATRAEARRKLAQIRVKVGYPDHWQELDVEISPTDLVGNLLRLAALHQSRATARAGGPVDRDEWIIHPQTVNAYYYPPGNEIVFPAAILQPPFFDSRADDAANYGAIGGAIGHEISHAFDNRGRKYDGAGNLRDWWTAGDAARFDARAARLVAQYSACRLPDGLKVNGELTLGENLGDLSGLSVAWKAWRLALGGRRSPVLDGFTGEQRFFIAWAQAWRFEIREPALREWLAVNPHSPPEFRVNTVVSNLDAFYDAFGVQPGDGMFRAPEDRVKIW